MGICPNCGSILPEGATYCFACNTKVPGANDSPGSVLSHDNASPETPHQEESDTTVARVKRCAICGALLRDDARYCYACESRVQEEVERSQPGEPASVDQVQQQQSADSSASVETGQVRFCAKCGHELVQGAAYCAACGTKLGSVSQPAINKESTRRSIPRWLGVGAVLVAGVLLVSALRPPTGDVPAQVPASMKESPSAPAAVPPVVTAVPSNVELVGAIGDSSPSESIDINCSDAVGDLVWRATSDVPWLNYIPASDQFESGVSELSVWVTPSALEEGTHRGTLSLRIDGYEPVVETIEIMVEIQSPTDPMDEATRVFWETEAFRAYWSSGAQRDVRDAVRKYSFPEYGFGIAEAVYFKSVDFDFLPEEYPRPIARVHCEAQFVEMQDLDQTIRTRMTYYTDTMVILQVAPGPYSLSHNEWQVVSAFDYDG